MKTKMNRTWTTLLTASLMSLTIPTHAATLLVGSYTDGASQGIYRYQFDEQRGHIDPTPQQVVKSVSPSWLVLSADRRLLFAVNETPGGNASSFSVSAKGDIKPLNQVASQGDEPTHASLSHDQRYLFVANYAVNPDPGGSLAVMPVARDGQLKPVVQQLRHRPSGVNRERQAGGHVHSLVSSPNGQYLYASDLGADKVFIYRYDGASPDQPLSPATPPAVRCHGAACLPHVGNERGSGDVRCQRCGPDRGSAPATDRRLCVDGQGGGRVAPVGRRALPVREQSRYSE